MRRLRPRQRIPGATYRLQLTREFGFAHAAEVVAYLAELGIDTVYTSPILAARLQSVSNYDVIDPCRIDHKLGTESELQSLGAALRVHDMGMLLDIVPNHMAASGENPYWADVLMLGRDSEYAGMFDIDWDAGPALPGEPPRLVLPVLGAPYHEVLDRGELRLAHTGDGMVVKYYEHSWPIASPVASPNASEGPGAERALGEGEATEAEAIAALLERQRYQLGYWRVAAQKINYRRFFDISDLVGVRVEEPDVFDLTHCMILCLIRQGIVTGLRIDHIDGLRQPREYIEQLRSALPVTDDRHDFYIVVEKILSGDEVLPGDWRVHGTTGYEFVRALNGVFVDPAGLAALEGVYARFLGFEQPFPTRLYQQKKRVMRDLFPGEIRRMTTDLCRLAIRDRHARDILDQDLEQAFIEVMACFPVYRTYTRDLDQISAQDRHYITAAVAEARDRNVLIQEGAYDFIERLLTLDLPSSAASTYKQACLDFVLQWQQLTGPITAKGLEDTALYQDFRLLSLNSVGGEPDLPAASLSLDSFHRHNAMYGESWPHSLVATSTHDSKRSEDVRARLHVLSDLPGVWSRALSRWSNHNAGYKQQVGGSWVPTRNEEVLIYQSLLGAWPLDEDERDSFVERFIAYIIKASREAKLWTSWIDANEPHEQALIQFVRAIVDDRDNAEFMHEFRALQRRLAFYGAINSLSQVVLKATSPGVPDFYQGTELWTLTLVDPDNRRPVDFARRRRLLAELDAVPQPSRSLCRELRDSWRDGRIKLYVTLRALRFRRAQPSLFSRGAYVPVAAEGTREDSVCAYVRHRDGEDSEPAWCLAVVPRRVGKLSGPGSWPIGQRCWKSTRLVLPSGAPRAWRDILTGELVRADDSGALSVARIFRTLPVAILEGASAADT